MNDEQDTYKFEIIGKPLSEETVLEAVARAEAAVERSEDPSRMPDREQYIKDFAEILRLCTQQDRFRVGNSAELDEAQLATAKPAPLRIRTRTAARLIRVLGDLEAAPASAVLTDFLKLPPDLDASGLQRPGDIPADWALFQIGDAALSPLRAKMVSNDMWERRAAALAACHILGPRAADQLREWIAQAASREETERLQEYERTFELIANNTRGENLKEYRREALSRGRLRVASRKRNPAVVYPDEMDEWRRARREKRTTGKQP